MQRPPLPLVALALIALACGGSGERMREARAHVAAGDLERAEQLLAELDSAEARALRTEIERVRARRAAVDEELAAILARVDDEAPNELRAALQDLARRQSDRIARERVERALSDLADRLAEHKGERRTAPPGAAPLDRRAPEEAASRLIAALRADVREALAQKQWARAQALLDMLVERAEARTEELALLRRELAQGQGAEIDALLGHAADLEEEQGLDAARELIARNLERFPRSGVGLTLHARLAELDRRIAALARREAADESTAAAAPEAELDAEPAGAALPEVASADELAAIARQREESGDLAGARAAWLAASRKLFPGDLRDDYVGCAQDLRARLALRTELAAEFARTPATFESLGITAVGPRGWTSEGRDVAWGEIALDSLKRAAALTETSPLARRGLICEALRTRDPAEVERALTELARMVERGELDAAEGADLVARARAGLGSERYQLERGRWVARAALENEALAAELARLTRAFERAQGEARDSALAALEATGDGLRVHRALRDRSVAALHALDKGRTLEDLSALAELRLELDRAREAALGLIFDEETYFYPYNPPEPPHTASDYARAQRRVDELVGAVREVWATPKKVELPKAFRAALEELAWCRDRCGERDIAFALPERVPAWVLDLPRDAESLALADFAWNADEAGRIAYSRKVVERNERLWSELDAAKAKDQDALAAPDRAEREQVRITNAYRTMMGRRALAWNPRIQRAAQGHSDYMSRTGDFGHFEDDPARRTPFDRMRLEGYLRGVSENCAMVGGDPEAAHDGWLHSSGHHRNILMDGHREMASAIASLYWTQNFGSDTAFTGEL
jgi:hypothetical protein